MAPEPANKADDTVDELATAVRSGDRAALSRAITLLESTRGDHREQAQQLLLALLPESGNAQRVGITGVPGVGKSTAIEALGMYLIEQGHRRIGLIRAHMRDINEDERYQGYQEALVEAGLPVDVSLVIGGETEKHRGYSEETGYEAMQKLLRIDPPVTAVFACSDVQALGAWRAIVDEDKGVPDEIALVGYDDLKSSHYLGLTSINQRMKEVGEQATKTLLQRMRGEKVGEPDSVLITPEIIVRRSSLTGQ